MRLISKISRGATPEAPTLWAPVKGEDRLPVDKIDDLVQMMVMLVT